MHGYIPPYIPDVVIEREGNRRMTLRRPEHCRILSLRHTNSSCR